MSGVSGKLMVTLDLGLTGEIVEFFSGVLLLEVETLTGGVGDLNLTIGGVGVRILLAKASSLVRI